MEDWMLDIDEPWPQARHMVTKRPRSKRRVIRKMVNNRFSALQDDRAETYDPYSCDRCSRCTCCCRCPDERPVRRPLEMYVLGDGTERRLTASEVSCVFATKYLEELHEAMLWNKPFPIDPYSMYNYGDHEN